MNHKVLLADDSLTIQKVIKITLANQPYEITDCKSEDELFQQLPSILPKIVFLDFNLSDKFTGYELTSKIKSISPSTKVLLLLGTFDTVDDEAMEKCGAADKIVKPFDSNKFIAICKRLIDTFSDEELPYPDQSEENDKFSVDEPEDQWKVSHSTEQKFITPNQKTPAEADRSVPNQLNAEISSWGMSIPEVINDKNAHDKIIDLPPVIETKFPKSADLDYPSLENAENAQAPRSKLISIDSLQNNDVSDEIEIEGAYVPDESDVSQIEAQILDEVEENLWHADEFEDLKKEVSAKIEEVKSNFQPSKTDFDDSLFKPLDEVESIDWKTSSSEGEISKSRASSEEIEELVKKYVKEYMDQLFQKNVEKVAWEVIPDLAENLIRQELKKISSRVIED